MSEERDILLRTLREDAEALEGIIRSYVVKMGLATPSDAETTMREIFNETVVAALEAAHTFDCKRRPIPWLLGIAIKRIQRALAADKRNRQREISISDLYPHEDTQRSEEELFERFAAYTETSQRLEDEERLGTLLAALSEADRQLLQAAVIQELDAVSLAADLGISPTALRVRLHRALKRLRGHLQLQEAMLHED
jgi:RNA polymerase sigma-70 factor (ECF subfamily)